MKQPKIKKEALYYFSLVVIGAFSSCQNPHQNAQNAISNTNPYQITIDTSLWLKDTRGIRDILEDSAGNLWFSSPDYIAKHDGKTIKYFSENDGLKIVGNLHIDGNGVIWIENGFSMYRYNGKGFEVVKLFDNSSFTNSESAPNSTWIQRGLNPTETEYVEPGVYELNEESTKFFPYPLNRDLNNKYLYHPTTPSYIGKDSTVWVGTMEKVFGLKDNTFISIGRNEMRRKSDTRQMGIRGIFVDSKGALWIADNGAGVFVYDGETVENFTKKHHLDEGEVEGSTLNRAFSIAEDSIGNMWFGTVYSGIWSYNPKTDEFNNYTKSAGVRSENIWTIFKTKKGELLFAGESPGAVYKFNGKAFDRIY